MPKFVRRSDLSDEQLTNLLNARVLFNALPGPDGTTWMAIHEPGDRYGKLYQGPVGGDPPVKQSCPVCAARSEQEEYIPESKLTAQQIADGFVDGSLAPWRVDRTGVQWYRHTHAKIKSESLPAVIRGVSDEAHIHG